MGAGSDDKATAAATSVSALGAVRVPDNRRTAPSHARMLPAAHRATNVVYVRHTTKGRPMDVTINSDTLVAVIISALAIGVLVGCAMGNYTAHTDNERGRHEPR